MFTRAPRFLLKRIALIHPFRALLRAPYPSLNSLQHSSHIKTSISLSKIQLYSFSSFLKSPGPLGKTEYQEEELALLSDFEPEKLPERKRVMEKYLQSKDLSLLTPNDISLISDTLCALASIHHFDGNKEKALKYFKEDEDLNQKAGIGASISLAHNFYFQGCLYLDQNDLEDAQHSLSEAERICKLLGDDKDAKILLLQCYPYFARLHYLQNDPDKALELYRLALEGAKDLPEQEIPPFVNEVYLGMGTLYASRNETEKTMEHWTKGLETATQYFGENSDHAYMFANAIAEYLYNRGEYQKALPYAKQSLEIALKISPKDSPEVAINYSRLGNIYSVKNENHVKALSLLKEAIKIFEKHSQEFPEPLSLCYFKSARIHALQGNPQEASNLLVKAEIIHTAVDEKALAEVYLNWAFELGEIENMAESCKTYFWKAAKIYEAFKPLDSERLLEIYANLGLFSYHEQDWEKACELMKKAESHFEAAKINPQFANSTYAYLSTACVKLGNVPDAFRYAQKVLECYQACGDPRHVGEAYFHFGVLHEHEGRLREALEGFKKSLEFPEMPPYGNKSRIPLAQERIANIENTLKVRGEKNSEASHKISKILETFKGSNFKK